MNTSLILHLTLIVLRHTIVKTPGTYTFKNPAISKNYDFILFEPN